MLQETRGRRHASLLLGALAAYFLLAADGHLYWHDVRYLYAASHYELGELWAGVWNPQYGEHLDPAGSGAFYLTKASFLAALRLVWRIRPPEHGGLTIAILLSLAAGAVAGLASRPILRAASSSSWTATAGAALLLTSPTLPYLGGKLVAEVLALPLALLALWAALRVLAARGMWLRAGWTTLAVLAYAAAVTSRVNISVLPIGFFLAAGWAWPQRFPRTKCWILAGAGLLLQVGLLTILFGLTGVGWTGFAHYFRDFASGHRGVLVSLVGGLAAGGVLLPLAGAALPAGRDPATRLLLAWLALTLVPTVGVVSLYQVEARYLVAPLVPLAGLAALGARRILDRVASGRRLVAGTALFVALVPVHGLALSILPYEVDRPALEAVMDGPELAGDSATLLVPWAYTDFHYLVTLWPERNIVFVHVPRRQGRLQPYSADWRRRLREWYGASRLVLERSALIPLLEAGPVYFLSWKGHPPLAAWAERLDAAGIDNLATRLRGLMGTDHGSQTWLVEDDTLQLLPVRREGQYLLSRVELEKPLRAP